MKPESTTLNADDRTGERVSVLDVCYEHQVNPLAEISERTAERAVAVKVLAGPSRRLDGVGRAGRTGLCG